MKYANSIVFVVVTAAVLITAYGVGLLVRHARVPANESSPPAQTAPTAPADSNDTVAAEDAGEPNEASPVAIDSNEPAQEQTEANAPSGDPNTSSDNENGNPGLTAD